VTPVAKVRMLVGLSGPTKYYEPGDIYECDESEAARLIGARYAVPDTGRAFERAVAEPATETRGALDHDGDGNPGGSLKGDKSTRAKGRAKKEAD